MEADSFQQIAEALTVLADRMASRLGSAAFRKQVDELRERLAALTAADQTEHVVDLRPDGWIILHPLACRPNLFDCPVNRAAGRAPMSAAYGRFLCGLDADGRLVLGEPVA